MPAIRPLFDQGSDIVRRSKPLEMVVVARIAISIVAVLWLLLDWRGYHGSDGEEPFGRVKGGGPFGRL